MSLGKKDKICARRVMNIINCKKTVTTGIKRFVFWSICFGAVSSVKHVEAQQCMSCMASPDWVNGFMDSQTENRYRQTHLEMYRATVSQDRS